MGTGFLNLVYRTKGRVGVNVARVRDWEAGRVLPEKQRDQRAVEA